MERHLGNVIFYNPLGWGFLADVNEQSHFFHVKDLKPLRNGARIIPKKNDLFIFSLRPSTRRPGLDEAYDLELSRSSTPAPAAMSAAVAGTNEVKS